MANRPSRVPQKRTLTQGSSALATLYAPDPPQYLDLAEELQARIAEKAARNPNAQVHKHPLNPEEWQRCSDDEAYFINTYCKIFHIPEGQKGGTWIPFSIWPAQLKVLKKLSLHKLLVILKARQLGLTWLCLAHVLYLMLFRPAAIALLFSRREEEAKSLLKKLLGMFEHLPDWLKTDEEYATVLLNKSFWQLRNGSSAQAFPTTAGDSYTASIALADEFDLVENQQELIDAVQPTIDAGGQMILLSRSDKDKAFTAFKRTFLSAIRGTGEWKAIFLPWYARPGRTKAWYQRKCEAALARDGSLDAVHEQYPGTYLEAIQGRSSDKRIPAEWLEKCYQERKAIYPSPLSTYPTLRMYERPDPGKVYLVGMDPAEGNPTSDPSSLHVINELTGEEVAQLSGKFQPTEFALIGLDLAILYNRAALMVERNNHGFGVLAALDEADKRGCTVLNGHDGRPGWNDSIKGKTLMYTEACDLFSNGDCVIHSESTKIELGIINGQTMRAPDREHDDEAVSFLLAQLGRTRGGEYLEPATYTEEHEVGAYSEVALAEYGYRF